MGYLTASIEWAHNTNQPDAWKHWWYNPDARIYNFMGKDNIEFHTIIWPAELMGIDGLYRAEPDSAYDGAHLNLPYDVPANEFMNIEGRKFSKSRNWAIWIPDILERYDPDAIRYCVAAALPESKDSDFSWAEFVQHNNNELVAKWGNLVNRILSYAVKNFNSEVPTPGELHPDDLALIARAETDVEVIGSLLNAVKIRAALQATMALTDEANAYLERRAPWKRIKEDRADAGTIVYTALRVIDTLKILWAPFLPFTSEKLHGYLGYDGQLFGEQRIETVHEATREHNALIYDATQASGHWQPSAIPAGQKLREPAPLFKKLGSTAAEEAAIVTSELARLGQPIEQISGA